MSRRNVASLRFAVIAAVAGIACSDESPVAPDTAADPTFRFQAAPGAYALDFLWNGVELILLAHVEDAGGNPAKGGAVSFQYCSYKGLPPNDITQPDEAPSTACADGSGAWATLAPRIRVNASGDAALNFGAIRVVNVIGFRYRYTGQGSGIANEMTGPKDWTR